MTNVVKNELRKTSGAGAPRPVLVARDIVKELGQGAGMVRAVKGVDIALMPGELTLLMGPSGSGKTTLLSILGCILAPTSGTITIDGVLTENEAPEALAKLRRTHIGYIFQSYNLFPTLNAVENVRIALDVAGVSSAEAITRAEQALRDVGLSHKFKSFPANLSGGEKQRVAVARAIASKPSIVLADEPTAALDSENGHGVMRLLSEIARSQNRAILVVTHDPRTLTYADRVIKIEDGVIVSVEHRERSEPKIEAERSEPERQQFKNKNTENTKSVADPKLNGPASTSLAATTSVADAEKTATISVSLAERTEPVSKRRRKNADERQMKPLQPEDVTAMIQKRKTNA